MKIWFVPAWIRFKRNENEKDLNDSLIKSFIATYWCIDVTYSTKKWGGKAIQFWNDIRGSKWQNFLQFFGQTIPWKEICEAVYGNDTFTAWAVCDSNLIYRFVAHDYRRALCSFVCTTVWHFRTTGWELPAELTEDDTILSVILLLFLFLPHLLLLLHNGHFFRTVFQSAFFLLLSALLLCRRQTAQHKTFCLLLLPLLISFFSSSHPGILS